MDYYWRWCYCWDLSTYFPVKIYTFWCKELSWLTFERRFFHVRLYIYFHKNVELYLYHYIHQNHTFVCRKKSNYTIVYLGNMIECVKYWFTVVSHYANCLCMYYFMLVWYMFVFTESPIILSICFRILLWIDKYLLAHLFIIVIRDLDLSHLIVLVNCDLEG